MNSLTNTKQKLKHTNFPKHIVDLQFKAAQTNSYD